MTVSDVRASQSTHEEDLLDRTKRQYYLIQQLRAMYSQEVFDYCLKKHGVDPPQLQGCMLRQEGFRTDILERAHKQLGRRSLAEMLYYDCLDFYRGAPISKTVKCVETRLILRKRLNQPDAEAEIYRRCEVKWRKHSIRAVRNCSVSAASYFEDTGKYRD